MKTLIAFCLLLNSSIFAQNKVPKQSDLLKQGVFHFFLDLPGSLMDDYLKFYRIDPYSTYVRSHNRNPDKSPFSTFIGVQQKRRPHEDNSFTFVNADYDFEDVAETEYGVCSSVTFSLRRFNMLAHFDRSNEAQQIVPDRIKNYEKWVQFYKRKIDDIYRLKPTVFPLIENLYELSSIPEFKLYIKKQVLNLWVIKNVSIRGLIQFFSVKEKPNLNKMKILHAQLSSRLMRGYNPIVFMSQPRSSLFGPGNGNKKTHYSLAPYSRGFGPKDDVTVKVRSGNGEDSNFDHWIHVVQVYKLTPIRADGSFEFFVWDINEELIEYAQKKVEVKSTGEVHWPDFEAETGYYNLSAVKLFPQDDKEVGIILKNKAWWCHYNPKFKKYCYDWVQ